MTGDHLILSMKLEDKTTFLGMEQKLFHWTQHSKKKRSMNEMTYQVNRKIVTKCGLPFLASYVMQISFDLEGLKIKQAT